MGRKKKTPAAEHAPSLDLEHTKGNYIAEWHGHRVYPTVAKVRAAYVDQSEKRCPFLSEATLREATCIKPPAAKGICTISTTTTGARADWLVCPYRAFDPGLLDAAATRLFQIPKGTALLLRAAPTLDKPDVRKELIEHARAGGASITYLTDKLGGEIQLGATDRSPQMAFDVTFVELVLEGDRLALGRYGVLEIQTMDFHGSYKHAVKDLEDSLRLFKEKFHNVLSEHREWLSNKIEGPNIANVFKRTFYQMVIKFQLGGHGACAGAVMAVPKAVWSSWQRHLGAPTLAKLNDGTYALMPPEKVAAARAWIFVFEIDTSTQQTPSRLVLDKVIATDAETITKCALQSAPQAVLAEGGAADRLLTTIQRRLVGWWPQLAVAQDLPILPS